MRYRIEGAQSFRVAVDSAAEALTLAEAAARQFPPLRVFGPQGELTLDRLRAAAEAEQTSS